MKQPAQPDLFTHIETTIIKMADDVARGVDIGFDFLASADEWAKPRPGFETPEWLKLPTDEMP